MRTRAAFIVFDLEWQEPLAQACAGNVQTATRGARRHPGIPVECVGTALAANGVALRGSRRAAASCRRTIMAKRFGVDMPSTLERFGLVAMLEPGPKGMVRLIAARPA